MSHFLITIATFLQIFFYNRYTGLLLWLNLLFIVLVLCFISFFFNTHNVISLIMNSEFTVIIIFSLFMLVAVMYNINLALGIALSFLILGGLEVALNLILLTL